jgi:hypothetical protein
MSRQPDLLRGFGVPRDDLRKAQAFSEAHTQLLLGHEWLTVLNRRWCLTCGGFQSRAGDWAAWRPSVGPSCARDTPYAERNKDNKPK